MDIRFFDTLESTNNYCKLLNPDEVEEFTVFCAANQTAGVGQQGNVWVSEPGKNLTFSIMLKPTFLPALEQFKLTMALSVAVAETLAKTLPEKEVYIKWPNDIYVGNRKICGILTTNRISGTVITSSICGVGLNVNQTVFPSGVPNPTSLKILTCRDYDLRAFLDDVLEAIKDCYKQLSLLPNNIRDRYMSRLYRYGVEAAYIYEGEKIRATITDVTALGRLVLITDEGFSIDCSLKEISFVI